MVSRGLLYLLAVFATGLQADPGVQRIEQLIYEADQIHYQDCDKLVCLVPSRYFSDLHSNISLVITAEKSIPFFDGIEIDVIDEHTWHLTMMANETDKLVKFNWGKYTMLSCAKDMKTGTLMFQTNYTVVTSASDAKLRYTHADGSVVQALVCTYLVKPIEGVNITMKALFGAEVEKTRNEKMCLEIYTRGNGEWVVNETFCNYIRDLQPNMRLSHRMSRCTSCIFSSTICRENCSSPNIQLRQDKRRGCLYIWSAESLLVNDKTYTTTPVKISCTEGQWQIARRYVPGLSRDKAPIEMVSTLSNVVEAKGGFDCTLVSKDIVKNQCPIGSVCTPLERWESPLRCPATTQLTYYVEKSKLAMDKIECTDSGVWVGTLSSPKNKMIRLVKKGYVACGEERLDDSSEDEGFFLADGEKGNEQVLLRRDAETNYETAIIAGAAAAVVGIIIIIVIFCFVFSCMAPKGRPVGMPSGESSHEPRSSDIETDRSFKSRLALLMSIVANFM